MNKTNEPAALAGIEPVARYFEQYQGQPIEEVDELRYNETPEDSRFKLYTAATVERLQAELAAMTQDKEYAWKNVHILEAERQKQDKELEASQAREQQLRDAVNSIYMSTTQADIMDIAANALLLPQDDTALRQQNAKLLRKMADRLQRQIGIWTEASACVAELRHQADELRAGK